MPEEVFDHDEIYEEARKDCNKENVDYSLSRLHALAFEAEYDLSLTSRYDFVEEEPIDNLLTSAQHVRLRKVFSMVSGDDRPSRILLTREGGRWVNCFGAEWRVNQIHAWAPVTIGEVVVMP